MLIEQGIQFAEIMSSESETDYPQMEYQQRYVSESGDGSYSSPMHSPPQQQRFSESSEGDGMNSPPIHMGGVPIHKVRQIVATQTDVLPFTPDGIYALAKVSELFVEHLLRDTMETLGYEEELGYDQLAETVLNDDDLSYLHDFFPARISFEEAQLKAAEKMREEQN